MTNTELFALLELPIETVSPELLEEAYHKARRIWFFRQYEPQYILEARHKLDQVETAYRILRDLRRQPAIVREAKAERIAGDKRRTPGGSDASPGATVRHRPKIVREMIRTAESLVAQTGRRLSEDDVVRLARAGFGQGLEYADALDIAERLARLTLVEAR